MISAAGIGLEHSPRDRKLVQDISTFSWPSRALYNKLVCCTDPKDVVLCPKLNMY